MRALLAAPRVPVARAAGTVLAALRGASLDRRGRSVLRGVDLDVRAGEVLVVVGPNGAGKSTLLGLLSGDLVPTEGVVELDGVPLSSWSPREQAMRRSVLPQRQAVAFGFTALDVVRMGRAPWRGTPHAAEDDPRVAAALAAVDATGLAHRPMTALSGGEQARVQLARVLAQATALVLLDEPTASLDLRHAEQSLQHARQLAGGGRAVVVVVHELNLAAAYADRVALLSDGVLVACDAPRAVLTAPLLSATYSHPVEVVDDPRTGAPLVLPHR